VIGSSATTKSSQHAGLRVHGHARLILTARRAHNFFGEEFIVSFFFFGFEECCTVDLGEGADQATVN